MSIFREQFKKMKELLDCKDDQIKKLSEFLKAALELVHSKNKQIDSCIDSMQDAVNKLNQYEKSEECWNAVLSYVLNEGYMESPLEFLRCWNEGNFDALREEWPDAPKEIYYADPLNEEEK